MSARMVQHLFHEESAKPVSAGGFFLEWHLSLKNLCHLSIVPLIQSKQREKTEWELAS